MVSLKVPSHFKSFLLELADNIDEGKSSSREDPKKPRTANIFLKALFMPYDHRNRTPDGLASQIIKSMLEDLNHLHCQNGCLVGSGGGFVGYLAHGTSIDYMYDIIKLPMSFTFEVRTFKGHTNEKNFVGLAVNNEYIACGNETNEVFVYHKAISKPAAWNRFSSSDMDGTDDDAASYFISAVCWKSDSPTMLTANSQGTIKVLVLAA